MKKAIALILALTMCLSLCACSDSGSDEANSDPEDVGSNESIQDPDETASESNKQPEIEYTTYTVGGLTFELPTELTATQNEDELSITFNQTGMLNVSVAYDKITSTDEFEYYCDTFYVGTLEKINVSNIQYEKTTLGTYPAYEYTGQTLIAGSVATFNSVALLLGTKVITIMMLYSGNDYNYTEIYTHLLTTLQ